jgi:hypothetical protein
MPLQYVLGYCIYLNFYIVKNEVSLESPNNLLSIGISFPLWVGGVLQLWYSRTNAIVD